MTTIITGKKGCGKTHLTQELIKQKQYLLIYDINKEYNNGYECSNIDELENAIEKKQFPILFFSGDENEIQQSFDFLYYREINNITLVIDEFHIYSDKYHKKSKLFNLIRLQRHRNINLIGITQRITDINTSIFSQCDYVITFKQTEFRDLETLQKLGFNPDEIKNLGDYAYRIKKL